MVSRTVEARSGSPYTMGTMPVASAGWPGDYRVLSRAPGFLPVPTSCTPALPATGAPDLPQGLRQQAGSGLRTRFRELILLFFPAGRQSPKRGLMLPTRVPTGPLSPGNRSPDVMWPWWQGQKAASGPPKAPVRGRAAQGLSWPLEVSLVLVEALDFGLVHLQNSRPLQSRGDS